MPIALIFPGQGAQHVGMGAQLAARHAPAKRLFEQASEILGYDLLALCASGPAERLNATDCAQVALYVHSMAVLSELRETSAELWDELGAVAGLSLGEYSALAAAEAFSFETGLRLVAARGAAMQQAANLTPSGMASVLGLDAGVVEDICRSACKEGEILQVANLLCPGNIAISGHIASLQAAETIATEAGAMRFIPLAVAGAFHTEIMRPAVEPLRQAIATATISSPRVPIYCNVDATAYSDAGPLPDLLARQVVSPVLWEKSLRGMIAAGIDRFYEVGAGRVLAGTLKRIDRKIACESLGD